MSSTDIAFLCPSCRRTLPEGAKCDNCGIMAQEATGSLARSTATAVIQKLSPSPPPSLTPGAVRSLQGMVLEPAASEGQPPLETAVSSQPDSHSAANSASKAGPLQEYLSQGFEVFLMTGIGGTGKTHLMETFRGQDTSSQVLRGKDGLVISTRPFGFDIHPFPHGKRKVIFVDASGEQYKKLYSVSETAHGKEELELLKEVSSGLGGLLVMFNLHDYWQGLGPSPLQPRSLSNLLRFLRWLLGGGQVESVGQRTLPQRIDSEVERMPRIKVPVMFLFSLADHLHGHDLPSPKSGGRQPGRKIFPPGEDPVLLLHHYVPELLKALEKHVHCFHIDFCHSVVTDQASQKVIEESACGVELAKQWLLAASARRPLLSTSFWLDLDRRFRGERWVTLPPSKPLRGG